MITYVKYTPLVLVALLIDGMQAIISWGIATIAAFPVTAGGTAAGCIAGQSIAGEIGCWFGGGVIGLLSVTPAGLVANGLVAQATIPLGIGLGLAINMALSLVLGGALIFLLALWGLHPFQRLWWSGAELVPGVNNIPCWTFFTLSTIWAEAKNKNPKTRKSVLSLTRLAMLPTQGIMSLKEDTGRSLGTSEGIVARPSSAREMIRESERMAPQASQPRVPLSDIRPPTITREKPTYAPTA